MSNSGAKRHEQKRVTITAKRQFTIPQRFYTELGFEREAICTMGEGLLIIQPIKMATTNVLIQQSPIVPDDVKSLHFSHLFHLSVAKITLSAQPICVVKLFLRFFGRFF